MFLKMQNFSAFESLIILTAVKRKKNVSKISVRTLIFLLFLCELPISRFFGGQHMTRTYTQNISGDNLFYESNFSITIVQL